MLGYLFVFCLFNFFFSSQEVIRQLRICSWIREILVQRTAFMVWLNNSWKITLYFLQMATISGSLHISPSMLYMPSTTTIIFFHGLCDLGCPSAICSLRTLSKCDGAKSGGKVSQKIRVVTLTRNYNYQKKQWRFYTTYYYVEKHEL